MSVNFGDRPPKQYPVSDNGTVLRGGEKVKIYQDWGGARHYLCQNCESWTSNVGRAGTWIVDPVSNFFDYADGLNVMLIEQECKGVMAFAQLELSFVS